MAEPDELTGEEAENTDAVEEKSKGGSMMMILLPLMLISAGGGAYLAYSQYPSIVEMRANMGSEDEEDAEEGEEPIEYGEFMELSNIIINPANSNGRRLLMLSLGIESADPAHLEDLTAREMVVRDTIMKVLSRRTVDELASIEVRSTLKDELIVAVNSVLTEGEIQRMYFTQYVIQ